MVDETASSGASEGSKEEQKTEAKAEVKTEPKEETSKALFTPEQQAYINQLVGNARSEGRKAEQARVEGKLKEYTELKAAKAKLEEIENSKLAEDEKAAKKLKALEDQIAEKEKELADRNLKELKRSKIEQAIADGKMALPPNKTIDSVVRRMLGTTEEELDSDIEDLIGFFPPKAPSKGLGTGTQTSQPSNKAPDIQEQIRALTAKASDPKTPQVERSALNLQILSLKMQATGQQK